MPKRRLRKTAPNRRGVNPKQSRREVTVDDVFNALVDLFDHLGLDAGRLASRLVDINPALMASRQLYPYASAIGELLTEWHQNPEYLDTLGNPAPLKLRTTRRSFRHLAAQTVPNIEPKDLLLELERIGAVSIDDKKYISVRMRSLPVYEDKHLAIQHTLVSLHTFIKTLRHNLNSNASNSDQLFHRVAWNGDLDAREIPLLKIRVKRQGQSFLESCDNWMTRRTKSLASNLPRTKKRAQVFVGVYLAVDPN